jgi:hypothetical protein
VRPLFILLENAQLLHEAERFLHAAFAFGRFDLSAKIPARAFLFIELHRSDAGEAILDDGRVNGMQQKRSEPRLIGFGKTIVNGGKSEAFALFIRGQNRFINAGARKRAPC